MTHCVDTSGLTTSWRYHYPPDIFPTLWRNIEEAIRNGTLVAADEVREELKRGGDDLYDWTLAQNGFYVPPDAAIQQAVADILSNPEHAKLLYTETPGIVVADPFVIATARVRSLTVVSSEPLQTNWSPRKTKIPNVCADLGVPHVSPVDYFRSQGWSF